MLSSPIITLTTDWKTSDFFVGMIKGYLLSLVEDARIVDVTHEIPRGDLIRAAFVVRSACMSFPDGAMHIIDVGMGGVPIAVRFHNQFFFCLDNGLPFALFDKYFDSAVRLMETDDVHSCTSPAYTIFARDVQRLCKGMSFESLGTSIESLVATRSMGYMEVPSGLIVYVNYIDVYGNAYLSIRYDQFEQVRRGRSFGLRLRDLIVRQISRSYVDTDSSGSLYRGMVLIVSVTGYLQLALPNASLEQLLGVRVMQQLRFDFCDVVH